MRQRLALSLLLVLGTHALSVRAFENPFAAWLGETETEDALQADNQHAPIHKSVDPVATVYIDDGEDDFRDESADVVAAVYIADNDDDDADRDSMSQQDRGSGGGMDQDSQPTKDSEDERPQQEDDDDYVVYEHPVDGDRDDMDDEGRVYRVHEILDDETTRHGMMAAVPDDNEDKDEDAARHESVTADERRLTEQTNAPVDGEPDVFAALAGIDLSPFHMESADKTVLTRLLDWAYDRAAHFSRFQDGFVHAEELGRLFSLALNPTDAIVPDEYLEQIEAAAEEMRAVQGLQDHEMAVPRGFISRGMPLRTLQQLAQQLHNFHSVYQRRRLTHVGVREL